MTGQLGVIDTEIVVVGGGPAGAICAMSLARIGRQVVLCEAAPFPRDHVGVCLSPGVLSQFKFLGFADLLECGRHRTLPIKIRWSSELFVDSPHEAFIVDRARLDGDLLALAAESGVRVLHPASVVDVSKNGQRWEIDARTSIGPTQLRSLFVVDARGRSSRGRHKPCGPPTIAVHGEWAGRSEEIVQLAAAEMSWSWSAPLASGRLLAVAFTTPRFFHRLEGSLEERYRHLLLEAGVLDTHSSLHSPPRVCDATPYLRDKATDALLRVGDADVALDPLSSSGIQAAVQSALCAAPVVNTLLSPGADAEAALGYWDRRRTERARSHERWSAQRYREAFALRRTEFWRTRAIHYVEDAPSHGEMPLLPRPEQAIALSSSATLIEAACLQGQFVVRKQCLTHPHLREPIAYVDGLFLAPMLRVLAEAQPAAHVIAAWSSLCSPGKGLALLGWLWQRQIAVAA